MKWFKNIFGKKESKEEKPLEPLLEEQPKSVPLEKNIDDGVRYDDNEPETIAPTLERQDEVRFQKEKIELTNDGYITDAPKIESTLFKNTKETDFGLYVPKGDDKKKKSTKPKKQAKKNNNFNDDASKPKGRNFLM